METMTIHVIASQRVGAKRRPMTGYAKQSIKQQVRWINDGLMNGESNALA